jgi:hypothetical protein
MRALKIFFFIILVAVITNVTAQTVYITKTGEKYHKKDCRYLKYSKTEIKLKEAIARAYEACKVCKPTKDIKKATVNTDVRSKGTSITPKIRTVTTTKKAIASQCTGMTKSGARCKRKTKNVNGRCYQH